METIIYRDIDLFDEAVGLLTDLAEEERPGETQRGLLTKYQIEPEVLKEPFAVWEELLAAGRKRLQGKMALVKEYFLPYKEDGILNQAAVALLADEWQYGLSLKERRQSCLALTEEERGSRFYRLIQSGYGLDTDVSREEAKRCRGLKELLECLEQSDYSAEQKWQLLQVYQDPAGAWDTVAPLLSEAADVVLEKEARWRPLIEAFYQSWQNRLKTWTIQEYIKVQTGVALDVNPLGVIVIPHILRATQATLAVKLPEEGWGTSYRDVCRMGLVANCLERRTLPLRPGIAKKQIAALLKLLAEESKLEILSLLRERPCYGGELARKLELTTATISHHMSTLVSYNLVNIHKEGNRVYYEVNEPVVSKLLENTGRLLLREYDKNK